jgi:hypothetical protein
MLILSHIGGDLPNHFFDCIKQTRKFFNGKIVLITNSKNLSKLLEYNIEISDVNFENKRFEIAKKINFYDYPSTDFWLYSLSRFFFIEDYVVTHKINDFVIYENDILIYSDLNNVIEKLSITYKNIAITIGDDFRATTGFSFFKSYEDLIRMNDDIIKIVQNPDDMNDIRNNYASCCPSEMVFIRKISKEKNYIKPLPLFPEDKYYNELGFVFDPAGYGQFLGGTSPDYGSLDNFIDKTTYIGKKLLNEEFKVTYSKEEGPTIINNNNETTKIYNLHIHSKKLNLFTCD